MDALPLAEHTDLPFASQHPGFMHACGHDSHIAMILALAESVSDHLNAFLRNVLFLFQPAEECSGGAKTLCETEILQTHRVSCIFGIHLMPGLPAGRVFSRPGPMMAQANDVTITVTGKSVHLSRVSDGLDALAAGSAYLQRAYTMINTLPNGDPCTLLFGRMVSGTARNAVSAQTRMEGNLRTYSDETFRFCKKQLFSIGRELELETDCSIEVHLRDSHPPIQNHECLYATVCSALGRMPLHFWKHCLWCPKTSPAISIKFPAFPFFLMIARFLSSYSSPSYLGFGQQAISSLCCFLKTRVHKTSAVPSQHSGCSLYRFLINFSIRSRPSFRSSSE